MKECYDLSQLLLDFGARLDEKNSDGDQAIHLSFPHIGGTRTPDLLLAHGADLEARGAHEFTPLHCAVVSLNEDAVEMLIDRGANVEALDEWGITPLYGAVMLTTELNYSTRTDVVRSLLLRKANPNAKEHNGDTLLHYAVKAGQLDVAKLLIQFGANPDQLNNDGQTPAAIAAINKDDQMLAVLRPA